MSPFNTSPSFTSTTTMAQQHHHHHHPIDFQPNSRNSREITHDDDDDRQEDGDHQLELEPEPEKDDRPPTQDHLHSSSDSDQYDEPIWDESNLKSIESIEAQHFQNHHPTQPNHHHHHNNNNNTVSSSILSTLIKPNSNTDRSPNHHHPSTHHPTHLEIVLEEEQLTRFHQPSHSPPDPSSSNVHRFLNHQFRSLQPNPKNKTSLYSRFRSQRGLLSVSDLINCLWCQVQTEYGLLSKRYLKPSQRPKSFISSSGAEIKVDQDLIFSRQRILDGGIRVHSKLEKEVAPDKIDVKVITEVDTWGLKIMNTIISLLMLKSTGMMREIRVLGFIGGFLIQGIIDQIDLIAVEEDSFSSSSSSAPNPTSPESLGSYGSGLSGSKLSRPLQPPHRPLPKYNKSTSPTTIAATTGSKKKYLVRISDSKTTNLSKLPHPDYTESARYQLMLYKFLYDQNASGFFDVERFGQTLGIDLDEPFSETFSRDLELDVVLNNLRGEGMEEEAMKPSTLRGMFELYHRVIGQIGASDSTLEIVYRERSTGRTARRHDPSSNDRSSSPSRSRSTRFKKKPKLDHEQEQEEIQLLTTSSDRRRDDDDHHHHPQDGPSQSPSSTDGFSIDPNTDPSRAEEGLTSSFSMDSDQARLGVVAAVATSDRSIESSSDVDHPHHLPSEQENVEKVEHSSPSPSSSSSVTTCAKLQEASDSPPQQQPQEEEVTSMTTTPPSYSTDDDDLDLLDQGVPSKIDKEKQEEEEEPNHPSSSESVSVNRSSSGPPATSPPAPQPALDGRPPDSSSSSSSPQPQQPLELDHLAEEEEKDRLRSTKAGEADSGLGSIEKAFEGSLTSSSSSLSLESMRPKYDQRSSSSSSGSTKLGKGTGIVGSYEFIFSPLELHSFLFNAIPFWNGDSKPIGVRIQDSNKCLSCEYKEDCEWRSNLSDQIIHRATSTSTSTSKS